MSSSPLRGQVTTVLLPADVFGLAEPAVAAAAAAAVGRLARAGALPAPTSVRHTACCRPAAAAAASPSPMDAPESSSAESHTVFHRTRCVHGHSAGWCLQVAAAAPPGKTLLEWWDSSFRLIQVGRRVAPPYMYLKPCEGRSADPSSEAPCTCSLHRLPAQAPCTGSLHRPSRRRSMSHGHEN